MMQALVGPEWSACAGGAASQRVAQPLAPRAPRPARHKQASSRVGVTCAYSTRSASRGGAAGRGYEGQQYSGRTSQQETLEWRSRETPQQVGIERAPRESSLRPPPVFARGDRLGSHTLFSPCVFFPAQNDGLDQRGVRLSRSQIISKSFITRSSGINLGVATQARRQPSAASLAACRCAASPMFNVCPLRAFRADVDRWEELGGGRNRRSPQSALRRTGHDPPLQRETGTPGPQLCL